MVTDANVFRDALNSTISGVIIIDLEGRIIYVNSSFLKMFKYKNEAEVLGKTAIDLFISDRIQKFADVRAIIDKARGETEEFVAERKDGTKFPVEVSSSIVADNDGNEVGRMASFKDISEWKNIEKAKEILEASTPVIQIWEGMVVTPIIGTLDSERAQKITESLLEKIVDTRSKVALLDITGVPSIDTAIAQHLIDTINAVQLLGSKVILTGIKPAIAQTLVHLGIDLSGVKTCKSLSEGMQMALDTLELKVVKENNS